MSKIIFKDPTSSESVSIEVPDKYDELLSRMSFEVERIIRESFELPVTYATQTVVE